MDKRPFRKSFTGQEKLASEPLTAGLSNVWRFSPLLTRRCSDLPETCFCSVSICRECPLLTWLISKGTSKERMYHLPAQENQSSVEGQDTPAGADYHRSVHGIRSGLPLFVPYPV